MVVAYHVMFSCFLHVSLNCHGRFLLPSILVIWNDVAAYTFGKMLGRTPLYTLSPNKTVEGFMLGAITTVAVGEIASDPTACVTQIMHYTDLRSSSISQQA